MQIWEESKPYGSEDVSCGDVMQQQHIVHELDEAGFDQLRFLLQPQWSSWPCLYTLDFLLTALQGNLECRACAFIKVYAIDIKMSCLRFQWLIKKLPSKAI